MWTGTTGEHVVEKTDEVLLLLREVKVTLFVGGS